MQTWCFAGLLFEDGRVQLQPGYVVDRPARVDVPPARPSAQATPCCCPATADAPERGPFQPPVPDHGLVQLVDHGNKIIGTYRILLAALCEHPQVDWRASDAPRRRPPRGFGAALPFPEGVAAVRFLFDNQVAHVVDVSPHKPEIALLWRPEQSNLQGAQIIRWEGKHPGGLSLHYTLLFSSSGGRKWSAKSLTGPATSGTIDFDRQAGGACLVAVIATDGINTTRIDSEPFTLPIKACLATIVQPIEGEPVSAGHYVVLSGQGYYQEEEEPELKALSWASSLDGPLGVGRTISVKLSPGRHVITLSAGVGSRVGTARIELETQGVSPPG